MAQPPFRLDTYDYHKDGYFDAFKQDWDVRSAVAVSHIMASGLRDEGLVYNTGDSIPVADIGCGAADSIQMYLGVAKHAPGFTLHATDYNADYTGANGIAHRNLIAAKAAKNPIVKINDFSVTHGDAFNGNLNATLGTEPNYFPLVFISHLLYHATSSNAEKILADVAHNILTPEGVGILFHLENRPHSFQYFRSKYKRNPRMEEAGDAPALEVDNPPVIVESVCKEAGIPIYKISYENDYYFAPMDEKYWEIFKRPDHYQAIENHNALNNLKKLYFITQRPANEFAAESGSHGLVAYMDEVRAIIAPDQGTFEKEGGCMTLAQAIQLIGNANAPQRGREKLAHAHAFIKTRIAQAFPS